MRIFVSAVVALLALDVLAACRSPTPAPPPVNVEVPTSARDTGAPPTADPAPSKESSAPAAPPPPPGMYTVAMSDRSNTCPPPDAGGPDPSASYWVTFAPNEEGKWTANLPINVGVGSPAVDRSLVVLEVGKTTSSALSPDRTCNYTIRREMKVTEVTSTKVVVDVHAEFTNAVRCTLPRRPVACSRDVTVTYTLTRPFCAARCIATPLPQRDGGVDATCACDGAR